MVGAEKECQRLASRALAFLKLVSCMSSSPMKKKKPTAVILRCVQICLECVQVVGYEVVSKDSSGLHHLLLASLLTPHSLGIPPTEDETARKAATAARVSSLNPKALLSAISV